MIFRTAAIALASAFFAVQNVMTSALGVEYYDVRIETLGSTSTRLKDTYSAYKTDDPMAQATIQWGMTIGNFATSGKSDAIAAWFYGYVHFDEVGDYKLCLISDNGSRLWVDDTLIVDNDHHAATKKKCNDITVAVAPSVKFVEVDFFENTVGAELHLTWVKPSSSVEVAVPFLDAASPSLSPSSTPSSSPSSEPSISNSPTEYVSRTH